MGWSDGVEALYFTHQLLNLHPAGLRLAIHLVNEARPLHRQIYVDILRAALARHGGGGDGPGRSS